MACRVQTCVSVISNVGSGISFTWSTEYDNCSKPCSNKDEGIVRERGGGGGAVVVVQRGQLAS